ncbi:MAG TPA: nucleoside-diphosphate kinase [Ruminiclostridium sp.]|nr:nucleoside-diphosphate kinase [Ruminiclostridium sp.]
MSVTFVMLKPDAVARELGYDIMEYFTKNGISIECFDVQVATEEKVRRHYEEVISKYGEKFAQQMLDMFKGKTVVPIILSGGDDIIAQVRHIVGATEPAKADKGTIRGDLGLGDCYAISVPEGRVVRNLIHASDSIEAVNREISIWLPKYKI